jgi:hypothetical protein
MKLNRIVSVLGILLAGCGAVIKGGPGLTAAEITQVSDTFIRNWCDKETELSQDTAITLSFLVATTDAANCKAAAPELAKKTAIEIGDADFEGELLDLRPLATLRGIQSLKIFHLGLSSVDRLYILRSLPLLTTLDLTGNRLTHVRGLARNTPKLINLTLSGNKLVDKPAESAPLFSKLETELGWKQLRSLALCDTPLTGVPTGIPKEVETLDLRHNKFGATPFTALAPVNPTAPPPTKLKTIMVEDIFAAEVTEPVRLKAIADANSWMKATEFKQY